MNNMYWSGPYNPNNNPTNPWSGPYYPGVVNPSIKLVGQPSKDRGLPAGKGPIPPRPRVPSKSLPENKEGLCDVVNLFL